MEVLLFRADRRTDTTCPAVAFRNNFVNCLKMNHTHIPFSEIQLKFNSYEWHMVVSQMVSLQSTKTVASI